MTDEEYIEKVLDYIEEKNKDKEPKDWNKKDNAVEYVCQVVSILGNVHDTMDIGVYLTATTKEAFYEIGAKAYGDAFEKCVNDVKLASENTKGFWIFKTVNFKKQYNKHIKALYETIQEIENVDPIIENYILPFMKKHYSKVVKLDAEEK